MTSSPAADAGRMMCPTCGHDFDAGTQECPNDGSALLDEAMLMGGDTPVPGATTVESAIEAPANSDTPVPAARLQVVPDPHPTAPVRTPASTPVSTPVTTPVRASDPARRGGIRPMTDRLIGQQLGGYVLQRELGRGGMGSVYLGEHALLRKQVAIKMIHPQFAARSDLVARFFHEARAVASFNNPHIVEVTDFVDEDFVYLVMELLNGPSLARHLEQSGFLDVDRIGLMLRQLCHALDEPHSHGIIHRDLKPENIVVLDPDGELHLKLLDFGIAKFTQEEDLDFRTRTGTLVGSPDFIAPEQVQGGTIDARSDIYSVGALTFYMLTGEPVFAGSTPGQTLYRHVREEPRAPSELRPDVGSRWDDLVLRCLAKDPEERFQSVQEVREALLDLDSTAAPSVISRVSQTFQRKGRHWRRQLGRRKRQLSRAAAGALVLAVAVGALVAKDVFVPAEPVAPVRLSFASTPPGAEVVDWREQVLGTTPVEVTLPRELTARRFTLRKAGFTTVHKELTLRGNLAIDVALAPVAVLSPAPVRAVAPAAAPAPAARPTPTVSPYKKATASPAAKPAPAVASKPEPKLRPKKKPARRALQKEATIDPFADF